MLYSDTFAGSAPTQAMSTTVFERHDNKAHERAAQQGLELATFAVQMDGSNLWREHEEISLHHMIEAVRLAQRNGKSELLIYNITPWFRIGEGDVTQVTEIQNKIVAQLTDACRRIGQDLPETRLSLRNGEFDVRCYLGREKPTDYYFED